MLLCASVVKSKVDSKAGGGEDEDPEKELQAKKSDAAVQLEEVETATGEEDETTAFQVRAKLFMLDTSGDGDKDGEEEKGSSQKTDSTEADKKDEKKDADKKLDPQWVVIGIGNLKINVPKPGCDGLHPYPAFFVLVHAHTHMRAHTHTHTHIHTFTKMPHGFLMLCLCDSILAPGCLLC